MEAAYLAIWFEESGRHLQKQRQSQGTSPGMAPQFENTETVGIIGAEDEEWAHDELEGDD